MTDEELERTIERLVKSRYSYEVASVIAQLKGDMLTVVVSAALARTLVLGKEEGRTEARNDIRERLGL